MLVIAVVGLAVGPAVHAFSGSAKHWRVGVDGLSVTLVIGLSLIHLAPHALQHGGFPALVAGVIGMLLPVVLSRVGGMLAPLATFVGLVLLMVHAVIDGAALAVSGASGSFVLGLAVVAHRLPVSFAVVSAARQGVAGVSPLRAAWGVIGLLVVATLGGFFLGGSVVYDLPEWVEGVLEAAVVGVLLHTLIEQPDRALTSDPRLRPWSVVGSLVGLLMLVVVTAFSVLGPDGHAPLAHLNASSRAFVDLALAAAPALLLGFSAIAVVRLLPAKWRVWEGVPPVLPLEAAALSVPLLGWPVALGRIVLSTVFLGMDRFVLRARRSRSPSPPPPRDPVSESLSDRLRHAGRAGFVRAPDRALPWYLLCLWVASLSEPLLGHGMFDWLPSAVHVPLMTLMGLVIPGGAAGITLVGAVGMHQGLSAGSILAFVFASPAVRVVSQGKLSLGRHTATSASVGLSIVLLALLGGWSVDLLLDAPAPDLLHQVRHPVRDVVAWLCFGVLGAVSMASLVRMGPRGMLEGVISPRKAKEVTPAARR